MRRPPRIRCNPDHQWRQLLSEGGAGNTKTYVMPIAGGCVIQVLCTEDGHPVAVDTTFVPGVSLSDFGDSE